MTAERITQEALTQQSQVQELESQVTVRTIVCCIAFVLRTEGGTVTLIHPEREDGSSESNCASPNNQAIDHWYVLSIRSVSFYVELEEEIDGVYLNIACQELENENLQKMLLEFDS